MNVTLNRGIVHVTGVVADGDVLPAPYAPCSVMLQIGAHGVMQEARIDAGGVVHTATPADSAEVSWSYAARD